MSLLYKNGLAGCGFLFYGYFKRIFNIFMKGKNNAEKIVGFGGIDYADNGVRRG